MWQKSELDFKLQVPLHWETTKAADETTTYRFHKALVINQIEYQPV